MGIVRSGVYYSKHQGDEIDNLLDKTVWQSNPNLLDNCYFVGGGSQQGGGQFPINQRVGKFFVKKDVPVYSDATLSIIAGYTGYELTEEANEAKYVNTTYSTAILDGILRYFRTLDCGWRYTGAGYGIDRWKILYEGNTMRLAADGLYINALDVGQYLPTSQIVLNREYTFSLLTTDNKFGWITFQFDGTQYQGVGGLIGDTGVSANFIYNWGLGFTPFFLQTSGQEIGIVAVKLELGNKSTLAHQENGVWVLNEVPNFQQELAKCQRYQVVFDAASGELGSYIVYRSVSDANYIYVLVPLPVTLARKTVSVVLDGTLSVVQSPFSVLSASSVNSSAVAEKNLVQILCKVQTLPSAPGVVGIVSGKLIVDANL